MTDARLREHERRARAGDIDAEARRLREWGRLQRHPDHLAVAAYCGHPASRAAFGIPPDWWISTYTGVSNMCWGPPNDGDDREDADLATWLKGLLTFDVSRDVYIKCENVWHEGLCTDPNPCPWCNGTGQRLLTTMLSPRVLADSASIGIATAFTNSMYNARFGKRLSALALVSLLEWWACPCPQHEDRCGISGTTQNVVQHVAWVISNDVRPDNTVRHLQLFAANAKQRTGEGSIRKAVCRHILSWVLG